MRLHPILAALLRNKAAAIVVAAQVALTIAIVCNALFVVKQRLDMANRPSGVLEDGVFQLQYVGVGGEVPPDERSAMITKDIETLKAIPGVVAVAGTNSVPLSTSGSTYGLSVDPTRTDTSLSGAAYFSGESYVKALGLKLVEGRDFEPTEYKEIDAETERAYSEVVIVSHHLAKALLPNETQFVGKTIHLGDGPEAKPMRIVGVVERLISSSGQTDDTAFRSFILPVRYLRGDANYAIRVEPSQLARVRKDAEKALGAIRTDRVQVNNRSMAEMRDRRYRGERSGATMLIAVTVGLLLVTASGIVGIASLWVNQRRKQIGIRRALGAKKRDVLRYFLVENLMITTLGVIAGTGLAIGLNQYLVSKIELARLPMIYVLFGVGAALILGLVAVFGPAWRAASVPPAVATRTT